MKTASIDLYAVLGVAKDADLTTIRTAFRARIRQAHPDGRPPHDAAAAHDEMVLLNLAYDMLKDPGKRAAYDFDRRAAGNATREPPSPAPPPPPPPAPPPKPRVIVLTHQYINLGPLWAGGTAPEQVVEARFNDGSPIGLGRVMDVAGSFWHVASETVVRDATCLSIRIQAGPVSPDYGQGRFTERIRIDLDGVTATVGVTAFITAPPMPQKSVARLRRLRPTRLGSVVLGAAVVFAICMVIVVAHVLQSLTQPDSPGLQMPGITAPQDPSTSAPESATSNIRWSVPQAGDSVDGVPPTAPAALTKDTLYTTASTFTRSTFQATDIRTGAVRWIYTSSAGSPSSWSVAPMPTGSIVVAVD